MDGEGGGRRPGHTKDTETHCQSCKAKRQKRERKRGNINSVQQHISVPSSFFLPPLYLSSQEPIVPGIRQPALFPLAHEIIPILSHGIICPISYPLWQEHTSGFLERPTQGRMWGSDLGDANGGIGFEVKGFVWGGVGWGGWVGG